MEKLYRFQADFQRYGNLSGLFIADEITVQEAIGKELYFGEVLGKHSDIFLTLQEDNIEVVTDDQEFIAKAKTYGLAHNGYNPLYHLCNDE